MDRYRRREFLADVGRGMLVASVGSALALDLGLAPAALADGTDRHLTFGPLEPLATFLSLVALRLAAGHPISDAIVDPAASPGTM